MKHSCVTFRRVFLVLVVGAIFSTGAFSQSLQAGGGIGYVIPSGDLGGTTLDYYAGSKYGLSGGINLHAKGRVNLVGFRLAAEIGYTSMGGTGDAEPERDKLTPR